MATLTESSDTVTAPWCVSCALRNPGLAADLVANLLLFIPLGIGLRLAGFRSTAVLFAALAISLAVELLQAYIVPGRVANVLDVATNAIGALAGAIAAPRWRTAVLPSAKTATWLALVSLGGLIAIVAASAWALTPATPRLPLIVRGLPGRDTQTRLERVLSAAVDGRAVHGRDTLRVFGPGSRPTRIEVTLRVSRSRRRGEASLRLVAEGKRFLELGIDDDELELNVRRKGEAVRLLAPVLRVSRPVGRTEGPAVNRLDTLILRATAAPWWMGLAVESGAAQHAQELRLHPLAGWLLLVSNARWPWLRDLLTALWTGVLAVPVAYWCAAAAARRPRLIGAVVLAGGIAIWAICASVGAPWPPWSAIAALIAAVVATWRVRQVIRT